MNRPAPADGSESALRETLDRCFRRWAAALGATELQLPPLLGVAELDRLDYFRRFPHEAVLATTLRPETAGDPAREPGSAALAAEALRPTDQVLVPAACYGVYLAMAGAVIDQPRVLTSRSQCFRNRPTPGEPSRLVSFAQRKIVFLGSAAEVRAGLAGVAGRIHALGEALGLDLEARPAPPEPAFEEDERDARVRQLFAFDEEFVHGDLAVAHTNYHRDSYTGRLDIRHPDGSTARAGCIGLNHDTWLAAMERRFGADETAAHAALAAHGRDLADEPHPDPGGKNP